MCLSSPSEICLPNHDVFKTKKAHFIVMMKWAFFAIIKPEWFSSCRMN